MIMAFEQFAAASSSEAIAWPLKVAIVLFVCVWVFDIVWFSVSFLYHALIDFIVFVVFPVLNIKADLKKYGKWALITGASDGLGLEYALALARRGINSVLIARNEDKLRTVQQEMERRFPSVKTVVRVMDFSTAGVEDYKALAESLDSLDIGILINNVGSHDVPFGEITSLDSDLKKSWNSVQVNVAAPTQILGAFLMKLASRPQRSLIIDVNSTCTELKGVSFLHYVAAKSAQLFLFQGLADELRTDNKNIDVMIIIGGYFTTKLIPKDLMSKTVFTGKMLYDSPENVARASLDAAGYRELSGGTFFFSLCFRFLRWMNGVYFDGTLCQSQLSKALCGSHNYVTEGPSFKKLCMEAAAETEAAAEQSSPSLVADGTNRSKASASHESRSSSNIENHSKSANASSSASTASRRSRATRSPSSTRAAARSASRKGVSSGSTRSNTPRQRARVGAVRA